MKEDNMGTTCDTNGTEFVQIYGRKTLWKETHERSTDRWEDKIEMTL
jgi:UDP-N-acetylglucosamine enolpyruvyl transferase